MILEDTEKAVAEVRGIAPTRGPPHRTRPSGYELVLCDL